LGSNKRRHFGGGWIQAITLGLLTLIVGLMVTWPAERVMSHLILAVALPALLVIITLGVVFDIIGVAVAVADEAPFHAMAAKRIRGAREALGLIRNADKVASFCNDIVGDVTGTVSGAAGALLFIRLWGVSSVTDSLEAGLSTLGVAFIAALTVGGKAGGKGYAMRRAQAITHQAGKAVYWFMRLGGRSDTRGRRRPTKRRGR